MEASKNSLTTEGMESGKALFTWGAFLQSQGLAGKLSRTPDSPYSASTTVHDFGKGRLYAFHTEPFAHDRMRGDCAQNPSDLFCLSYAKNGGAVVEQGGRESPIGQGDCFLVYSCEPFTRRFLKSFDGLSLVIPRSLLQTWVPFPFDLTARSLSRTSAFGKPLSALFEALSSRLDNLAVAPDALVEQICCLLALITGPRDIISTRYKEASYYRFRQSVREHYHDPNFDQSVLAHKLGVSTRTIQTTFSTAGTSFTRELNLLRMERARWFLSDPRFNNKSIDEISGILGYRQSSLFITHFRHTFGTTPARYRKMRAS